MNIHILKLLSALIALLPLTYAEATSDPAPCSLPEKSHDAFSIEGQAAAFFPLGSTMRNIYGIALPSFTLAGNWWFCKRWDMWLDVSYVFGSGHSKGQSHTSTHLRLIPITAGIKYFFPLGKSTDLYVGAGPSYSFLHTTDHSSYVHKHTSASNFGATVKTGLVYNFDNHWFVQGFFNYMYQKIHFHQTDSDPFVYRHSANLSSVQLGGSVGFKF